MVLRLNRCSGGVVLVNPGLVPEYNASTFIVPDEGIANLLNTELKLYEFKESMILFMLPTEQHYDEESDTYDCQLKQLRLEELLVDADKVLARRQVIGKNNNN